MLKRWNEKVLYEIDMLLLANSSRVWRCKEGAGDFNCNQDEEKVLPALHRRS